MSEAPPLLIDILKHLEPLPLPYEGLNPLAVSQEELFKYGFPRRPSEQNTAAFKVWKALVFAPTGEAPRPRKLLGAGDYQLNSAPENFPGAQETSQNWSGVVARSVGKKPFRTVFGQFTVPKISAPSLLKNKSYRCSVWIGLDGHDATSMSMPQIGITMRIDVRGGVAGPATYEPWIQWWQGGQPISSTHPSPANPPYWPTTISGYYANEGDLISCAVGVENGNDAVFQFRNHSMSGTRPFRCVIPGVVSLPPPYGTFTFQQVHGTTSEWIAERPTSLGHPKVRYHLPAFDRVIFTGGTIQDDTVHGPGPVRMIRMARPVGPPGQLQILARAVRRRDFNGSSTIVVGPGLVRRVLG